MRSEQYQAQQRQHSKEGQRFVSFRESYIAPYEELLSDITMQIFSEEASTMALSKVGPVSKVRLRSLDGYEAIPEEYQGDIKDIGTHYFFLRARRSIYLTYLKEMNSKAERIEFLRVLIAAIILEIEKWYKAHIEGEDLPRTMEEMETSLLRQLDTLVKL